MTDPCVIGGLFTSEILDMPNSTRSRWYKTLSPEEREIAMRIVDRVGRVKNSEALTGRTLSEEQKTKLSGENHPMFGKTRSAETRAKISVALSGENNPFFGKTHSEETRVKLSKNNPMKRAEVRAKVSGENSIHWKGGISFEPYCPAFTNNRKEHTRNRYNRVCVICGKSALQDWRKLSVHHVDENKMQGCDDWEWRLAVLCSSCHRRMHSNNLTLLLQLLLLNNRWHQTNFLLGVIEP